MTLRIENGTPINVPQPPADAFSNLHEFTGATFRALRDLRIPYVHQRHDRWCWAACAEMVLSTFDQDVDKCRVASSFLDKDCCNGNVFSCNRDCEIDDVLTVFEQWDITAEFRPHRVRFKTIQDQIGESLKPLELYISWGEGYGGHVLVVDGWSQRNQVRYVKIKDPWYGPGEVRLSDLINDYTVDSGKWEGTWVGFREN